MSQQLDHKGSTKENTPSVNSESFTKMNVGSYSIIIVTRMDILESTVEADILG